MIYNFEWNPKKAASNQAKHNVSFEEAATVFRDPEAITIFDPDHSETEERWLTIGISKNRRLLVVSHTFQKLDQETTRIRIISSRKTTKIESKQYGD
jgi:hypothetical protein